MKEFMKNFINKQGKKVFSLDYDGNLQIAGNLTLGENGILKAHMIEAFNNNDIIIIRNPEDMATPYKGGASAVYYLGENAVGDNGEQYNNSTWWEKYLLGYDCTIDTSSNADNEFIVYEEVFRVTDNDRYKHNKEMLDTYPNTNKIVVTSVQPTNPEESSHWEVKYYNQNDELLFNDILSSNLLYFTGYYFPFTSLNSDDYDEGYTDIVITVEKVNALKEISKADWSLYMPIIGGTFKGIINTENITPNLSDTYIIGTKDGRYKEGYFKNLYAEKLKVDSIEVSEMLLNDFIVEASKTEINTGDGLIISDSTDNNAIKVSNTLKFTGDKSKYLRQDGSFAIPSTTVLQASSLDELEETPGLLMQYMGDDSTIFNKGGVYVGCKEKDNIQISIKGVNYKSVSNTAIVPITSLNTNSGIISELDKLGNPKVLDLLKNYGKVTIIYSKDINGWYIEEFRNNGVVPQEKGISYSQSIINTLETITNNKIYTILGYFDTITVTINKFIWRPSSSIQFDGITKNKFLSQAGTFEYINTSSTGDGADYTIKGIINNISVSGIDIEGLDDIITIGLYDFIGINIATPTVVAQVAVANDSNNIVKQTVFNIIGIDDTNALLPLKLNREGIVNTEDFTVTWGAWYIEYDNATDLIKIDAPGTAWRMFNLNEMTYLLYTRKTENTYTHAKATVNNVQGVVIFQDGFTQDFASTIPISQVNVLSEDYGDWIVTAEEWEILKKYAVFFPVTGNMSVDGTYNQNQGVYYWIWNPNMNDASGYITPINEQVHQRSKEFSCLFPVRLLSKLGNGKFSISETFSTDIAHGNLQYNAALNAFRFAKNDYDVIGKKSFDNMSETYDGWIDLFAWGATGYKIPPYTKVIYNSDEKTLQYKDFLATTVFSQVLTTPGNVDFNNNHGYYQSIYSIIPNPNKSRISNILN